MPSLDCMGCCPGCKPRWKILVDSVYPTNPQDGIVKANMPKLTYYALSQPQKLDRIGEYLSKRLTRDLNRNRMMLARVAMESMDTLLVACHSQSLNLFVESFLKMVQKLLECSDPDMQCLATASFVKFSNVEEDTPSYHRRYDFFVSQFSAMCHSNHPTAKQRIRMAGVQGIQGVIRKTVCDELQPDIWEQHHMDKIVPSLLYNMHSIDDSPSEDAAESADTAAEKVFRDLVCRAAYNNLKSVLLPVLSHMDSHLLWTKTNFPSACFKIIMYSVQAQYGYMVVQMLMSHLDSLQSSPAELKASITDVLSEAVIISAGGSIGPSVLDLFNSLLKHLRGSVEYTSNSQTEKINNTRFQDSIINTIGEFANHLPDFQKIEILTFVISKMPSTSQQQTSEKTSNSQIQMMLLKTILKVATTYRTVLMANAFPSSFKNPLLQMSVMNKPETRLVSHQILHTLIDRHDNVPKFSKIWVPEDIAQLDLVVEKPSRQDVHFMAHGGQHILWHALECLRLANNDLANLEAVYCTMCLLLVELLTDETCVDFASFILNLQDTAVTDEKLKSQACYQIHALAVAFANIYCELMGLEELQQHVNQVLQYRRTASPQLLPERAIYQTETAGSLSDIEKACLLDKNVFNTALSTHGHDISNLGMPMTKPGSSHSASTKKLFVYKSSLNIDTMDIGNSIDQDTTSVGNLEIDSLESSPLMRRSSVFMPSANQLSVSQLKAVLESVDDPVSQEALRKQAHKEFETAPLTTIMDRAHSLNELHDRLFEILGDGSDGQIGSNQAVALESIKYPAMFVY
ncbi:protein EFR3 homolog B-like isoform X2 [Watersipora subatra]|uniref:protein EFR3 homolog B-like isoform X2 n=1 Tax=Watersipora subatra TaxID=2589382 RepID=UPI00355C31B0